jgi:hypothetical protein
MIVSMFFRRASITILAILFATQLLAQTHNNFYDSGATDSTTNGQIGVGTAPASAFHMYPNHGVGINFRLYNYTFFGTTWSSFHTIIGGNVKASETGNARMDYAVSHPVYGGIAIEMAPDLGFVFHTAPGPSTGLADTPFNSPRMIIDLNGNVGIGTQQPAPYRLQVIGNANVSGTLSGGNIQAVFQDIAEWVPVSQAMEPGTVVVVDPMHSNVVMPSHTMYDTGVAGVVSAQPGFTLGVSGQNKAQIATTGRVRIKVDTMGGPIQVGDLLVTSTNPGHAMRSTAIDVGGVKIHRPGTIIGKALEPLPSGEGEILALLSMQ